MKAFVLIKYFEINGPHEVVRVYMQEDHDVAKSDLALLEKFASDCCSWKLIESEIYGQ